jgi:hypothetical protein
LTIIGALPSTLVNGTVNDATQVQGDLQWIVDQVNSNGEAAGLAPSLAASGGSALIGYIASGSGAVVRTVQDALREGPVSVCDYGAVGDGVTDNLSAINAALVVSSSIYFPVDKNGGTNYGISAPIRSTVVVYIDGDPGVTITALAGFTGIAITKAGSPFTLKAIVAIFAGTNIGSLSDTRLAQSGKKVYIGSNLLFNCASNADYGVVMNAVAGPEVHCDVANAAQFGMWFGPLCFGGRVVNSRLMANVVGGVYVGNGCNGFSINDAEVWGNGITQTYGIYIDGAPGGTVGATGAVTVAGGYIEKCASGVVLNNAGQVNIVSVDIEGITGSAVVATCTAGATYGIINIVGGNLESTNTAISNANAYVTVSGGTTIVNGSTLEPFTSTTSDSIFNIISARYFDSGGNPTINPPFAATNTLLVQNQSSAKSTTIHKSVTPGGGSYSPVWEFYNFTSPSQPQIISSGFTFISQQLADTNLTNRTETDLFSRITDTNSGTPRNKSEVRFRIGFDSTTEAKLMIPDSTLDVSLGTITNPFQRAVAGNMVTTSAPVSQGAGTVVFGGTTTTTVGGVGGASALPATPLGYILINVGGVAARIPYYN